jgi:hypothetical protein
MAVETLQTVQLGQGWLEVAGWVEASAAERIDLQVAWVTPKWFGRQGWALRTCRKTVLILTLSAGMVIGKATT